MQVPGTPSADSVDCADYKVTGTMIPNNATAPYEFLAYIYDDPNATPDENDLQVVTEFEFTPGTPPTFELLDVAGDPGLSGDVLVYLRAVYNITVTNSSTEVLTC